MTTTVDVDAEVTAKRDEWLAAFHKLYVFFAEHPEEIDDTVVTVEGYPRGSNDSMRERAVRFSELAGPCTVDASDKYYFAQVRSTAFAPHHLSLRAPRTAIGHKVRDTVPEEWDWDALS